MAKFVVGKNILLAVLVGIVVYLTVIPLGMILYGTFRDGPPGTVASFTMANYVRAYGDASIFVLAASTMTFAVGAAVVSFALGGFLAWVTERTDTPLKGVIYGLALFPFVIPGILTTVAWVLLLSPTIGLINRLLIDNFFLAQAPFNIYSMAGMIWIFGIDNITLPFFLLAASLRSMDPALEEAGRASGMGAFSTFWHVNLKLLTPTIFAVLLLLIVRGIETFEVPAVIGLPAEVKVYASEIFLALRMFHPPDYNLAGTYSIFYLVVASIGVGLYLRATASAEKYATITGKGYRPRTLQLGRWRYLTLPLALGILFAGVILPFLIIALNVGAADLQKTVVGCCCVVQPRLLPHGSAHGTVPTALFNNIVVGVISATAAVVLGRAVTWVGVRTKLRGRKLLDIVAFTPMAFPGIVIGLALLWVYLTLPIPLYGTLWILVIAYVTKYVPIALRACHTALLQLHPELEEASDHFGLILAQNFCPRGFAADTTGCGRGVVLCFSAHLQGAVATGVVEPSGYRSSSDDMASSESGDFSELSALGVILIGALSLVALGTRIFATQFSVHER